MTGKPLCIRTFAEALQIRMNVKVFEKDLKTGHGFYKNFRSDINIYTLLLGALAFGLPAADFGKLPLIEKTLVARLKSGAKDVPTEYLAQTQRKDINESVGEYFAKTLTSTAYITKESLRIAVDAIADVVENDAALGKATQIRLKKLKTT